MSAQYPLVFNVVDIGNQLLLVLTALLIYVIGHKKRYWQFAAAAYPLSVGCSFVAYVFAIRLGLLVSTPMTSFFVFLGLTTINPTNMSKAFAMVFAVFSTTVYVLFSGSVEPLSNGFMVVLALFICAATGVLAIEPTQRKIVLVAFVAALLPWMELSRNLKNSGMEFDRQYISEDRRTF